MTVKPPALSGVTATSVGLPGGISVSILSGFDMKPCTRSALVSRRITGSSFLSVTLLRWNSYFFAVISIHLAFGLTAVRARLVFGAIAASAIPHAAAKSIVLTILFLNIVVFIFH